MSDLKPLLVFIQRHFETLHFGHMRKRRSFFNLSQKGLDGMPGALRFELNIAVRQVADPPGNPESRGFESDEITEPHALHPSPDRCADPLALFG